jgi:hypothetical protein
VSQSDIALANLTVRETIEFAIRLRIPNLGQHETDDLASMLWALFVRLLFLFS